MRKRCLDNAKYINSNSLIIFFFFFSSPNVICKTPHQKRRITVRQFFFLGTSFRKKKTRRLEIALRRRENDRARMKIFCVFFNSNEVEVFTMRYAIICKSVLEYINDGHTVKVCACLLNVVTITQLSGVQYIHVITFRCVNMIPNCILSRKRVYFHLQGRPQPID